MICGYLSPQAHQAPMQSSSVSGGTVHHRHVLLSPALTVIFYPGLSLRVGGH